MGKSSLSLRIHISQHGLGARYLNTRNSQEKAALADFRMLDAH